MTKHHNIVVFRCAAGMLLCDMLTYDMVGLQQIHGIKILRVCEYYDRIVLRGQSQKKESFPDNTNEQKT